MAPPDMPATSRVPSDEHARQPHCPTGDVVGVHESPEFVEMYTWLLNLAAASSWVPSADDAEAVHGRDGALVCCQVFPQLVETQIGPEFPARPEVAIIIRASS